MKKFTELVYEPIDLQALTKEVDVMLEAFEKALDVHEQLSIFEEINKKRNYVASMMDLCYARYTLDTKDEYYVEQMDLVDEMMPEVQGLTTKIYKVIMSSPFIDELKTSIGDLFFTKAEFALKTYSDEVKEDLKKENKLCSEYTKVIASCAIDYKGQVRNLSQMRPFAVSEDRETRKEASELIFGFMSEKQETLDRIYDEMVKIRTEIAKKLGFKNFIELGYLRMDRLDYDADMVAGYRQQVIDEIVPITLKLRERQLKRLGYDKLKYYDLDFMFASGNPKPQGDPEWIVDKGHKMYSELSPETKEFFEMMMEYEYMDLVARQGKSGGGYCMYLPEYETPFVFSNFNGTEGDITVLTHEMGHAFQAYQSKWIKVPELCDPTYETAEIHSMSMEFLTYPWMKEFFGPDTAKFEFFHMSEGILFIPYGVLVDHFQHYVYENPQDSPEERRAKWRELEKIYLPYKNYEGNDYLEAGGFWQKQSHIFEVPFYYIDYTLAQVCAYQFYVKDLEDHEKAWHDYMNLCKAGGSRSFLGLLELANLKSPFEEGTLKSVMGTFDEKLEAIDDSKF